MKCNQNFFGQEHLEEGTAEREWCEQLRRHKPAMAGWGFALRDRLPDLPAEGGGVAQVKYNGMLAVVLWDEARKGFVAWSPRGRCYYSLAPDRHHPAMEYLNARSSDLRSFAFLGETHGPEVLRVESDLVRIEFAYEIHVEGEIFARKKRGPKTSDPALVIEVGEHDR